MFKLYNIVWFAVFWETANQPNPGRSRPHSLGPMLVGSLWELDGGHRDGAVTMQQDADELDLLANIVELKWTCSNWDVTWTITPPPLNYEDAMKWVLILPMNPRTSSGPLSPCMIRPQLLSVNLYDLYNNVCIM